jgi:hypothetical protein
MRGLMDLIKSLFSFDNLMTFGILMVVVGCAMYYYASANEAERGRCANPSYAAENSGCARLLKHDRG